MCDVIKKVAPRFLLNYDFTNLCYCLQSFDLKFGHFLILKQEKTMKRSLDFVNLQVMMEMFNSQRCIHNFSFIVTQKRQAIYNDT